MKIEKAIAKLEEDVSKITGSLDEPIQKILSFIKKHKKILLLSAGIYLVYRYLFTENE